MFGKITFTAAAAVTVTMLILSAVFYWEIAGFILMGLSFIWFAVETGLFIKRSGLFGLAPLAAFIVLGAVWIPLSLLGLRLSASEVWFILGAMACAITTAFVWSR